MNDDNRFQATINDWLDEGTIQDAAGVPPDTEAAQQAANSLVIHGLLTDLAKRDADREQSRIAAVMAIVEGDQVEGPRPGAKPSRRFGRFAAFLGAAAAIAAGLLLMLGWLGGEPANAATLLDRVIEASLQPLDRTYRIRIVEEYPDKRPRHLPPERWRPQPKENLDGAILHVRGADKYVMVRELADGQRRITGCDGAESWAFREAGPVHVSADLRRFRGGMPGHKQGLPFVNPHSHLNGLRTGFDLELIPEDQQTARLVGTKKAEIERGMRRIEIWFDLKTGTIRRMLLVGLPRAKGGPKSVMLELTEQRDRGPDFFKHISHHEADRPVHYEADSP